MLRTRLRTRHSALIGTVILAGAFAMPATSQADDWIRPAYTQRDNAPLVRMQAKPDCTCRAKGSDFTVGTETCINSAMFRCVMDQNVTSWRQTQDSCPTS